MNNEAINSDILHPLVAAGGEIEISLWEENELNLAREAEKKNLVKVEMAGWGERTIMKLTKAGRAALQSR